MIRIEAFMVRPKANPSNKKRSNTMKHTGHNSLANLLSDTQKVVLNAAADHADGSVETFPENVKGGARAKVLEGLKTRGWITPANDGWVITDAGRAAIGRKVAEVAKVIEIVEAVEVAEVLEIAEVAEAVEEQTKPAKAAKEPKAPKPAKAEKLIKVRAPSKQDVMLSLLKQEGGTHLGELMSATGWQQHSVRGALSTLNKGLGGVIENAKRDGQRVYWIGTPAAEKVEATSPDALTNDLTVAA